MRAKTACACCAGRKSDTETQVNDGTLKITRARWPLGREDACVLTVTKAPCSRAALLHHVPLLMELTRNGQETSHRICAVILRVKAE